MPLDLPQGLIQRVRAATRILAFTGAGISAESGVSTFRDARTGLWAKYRPEDLATPEAFRRDPRTVWDWYQWRRSVLAGIKPNPGHLALARMQEARATMMLVTQNVDGLHALAGSRDPIELHGNVRRTICSVERRIVDTWPEDGPSPPLCPNCGALVRPDVVWFGESLPAAALAEAQDLASRCDLFLSIGTSTLVQPAASLPFIAKQAGAFVVEINPEPTPLSSLADVVLREKSGIVLPALLEASS